MTPHETNIVRYDKKIEDEYIRRASRDDFCKLFDRFDQREEKVMNELSAVFRRYYEDSMFDDSFRESVKTNFIPFLNQSTLLLAMAKACLRSRDADHATRYFCQLCWKKLMEVKHEG